MNIIFFVDRFSADYCLETKSGTKIIINAEMNMDDLYDLADEICSKTKNNDWSNLKEFINALEKQ